MNVADNRSMALRVKLLIGCVLTASLLALLAGTPSAGRHWVLFFVCLVAVLLSSGMKVSLPGSDSTMSVNFPFILLAVSQLSLLQVVVVAAISVFAQCKFRVKKFFSLVQIAFNLGNAINATALCWVTFTLLRQLHLASAPALAAGAVVYFFINTVPVAMVIAWTSGGDAWELWRTNFAWFLPFYLLGAGLSALANFLSLHYGLPTALLVVPAAFTIYRTYNSQIAHIRDREQHIADMEALHLRTIESLAMAIEAKDADTHEHLLRVRVYVTELGKTLGLTHAEMQAAKTAALLHDIGKLAVPERIINKPGKLTREEFEKMKIHPVVGADILERVGFPYPVVPIVRAHHEWWNGMGYPDGLKGEAIPIGARLLTAVDSFDAMASDRPYRRAMPLAEVMAVVKSLSGVQFDPRVVDALEAHYVSFEEKASREGEKLGRLETDIKVSRGAAPGAGYEQDSEEAAAQLREASGYIGDPAADPTDSSRETAQLLTAVAAQTERLLAMSESSPDPLDLSETLALLTSRLALLIPFDCVVLYLRDGEELVPQRLAKHAAHFFSTARIPLGEGISGWAALHEQSIVNGNPTVEPNYIVQTGHEHDLRSALSLPLRDVDAGVFGVFSLYASEANAFSRDHLRALEAVEAPVTRAFRNAMDVPAFERPPQTLKMVEAASEPAPVAPVWTL